MGDVRRFVKCGAGLAQFFEATEPQKEKYSFPVLRGEKASFFGLTEPSGGSDPGRAIQTCGVQDGDDWILNGSKIFISGADQAKFGILFARTSEDISSVPSGCPFKHPQERTISFCPRSE